MIDVPEEGAVKLYYYSRYPDFHMGLLNVWLNGQWGTVSDKTWTIENALTVCHQLGRNGVKHTIIAPWSLCNILLKMLCRC